MNPEDKYIANTYPKRAIEITRGEGALIYDSNGKEYIDCMTGNGVALLGHAHPAVNNAISEQVEKIITVPGLIYSDIRAKFVEKVTSITPNGLDNMFLSNTGTESVECAIKLARKHSGKKNIISMKRGFHGRTMGALSATWKPKYKKPFEPLIPGFSLVEYGNIDELNIAINEDTAAVILEAVQGESGFILPPKNYLKKVRELCTKKDVLMILDEVQTFGRTGNFFASQTFDIVPDILCTAKGIAGGVPAGLTISTKEIFDSLKPGEQGSTFGGNALASAAGLATLDTLEKENLIKTGAERGEQLLNGLRELNEFEIVRETRGIGAMVAIEFRFPMKEIMDNCAESGVLILASGRNTMRFLPPLVITKEQVGRVVDSVKEGVQNFKQ